MRPATGGPRRLGTSAGAAYASDTPPDIRYVKSRDGHIACQVFGAGEVDLVVVPGPLSHLEVMWEQPEARRCLEGLGSFARVAIFDRRGLGLSDPLAAPIALEEQVEDLDAVIAAAGFDQPALLGLADQGRTCILFAATRPSRVRALVTAGTAAYGIAVVTPEFAQSIRSAVEQGWGQGRTIGIGAPSRAGDPEFVEWWKRAERMSASPQGMLNVIDTISRTDVRDVLGSVQAPTLVLHRRGDRIVSAPVARELAASLPQARFVELPGDLSYYLIGDVDPLVEEVQEFLTGTRSPPRSDRILATLLFSDIVGSTAHASALGDSRWRELIARHDAAAARQLARFGGHQLKHTGDGFLARFDGPGRAIQCAMAIREAVGRLDLQLRCGVHTGECDLVAGDVRGLAVHIAARIAALANTHEIVTSSTVKDLVVGSGIEFAERGTRTLKGVPGKWKIYAVQ
jgi:class 3 adenylate cyclase